jgi:hypothetical protein
LDPTHLKLTGLQSLENPAKNHDEVFVAVESVGALRLRIDARIVPRDILSKPDASPESADRLTRNTDWWSVCNDQGG